MTARQPGGTPAMDPDTPGETGMDSIGMGNAPDRFAGASAGHDLPAERGTARRQSFTAEQASRIAALRDRLLTPMPDDGWRGWIGPLLITAFAAFTRFYRLAVPDALIFDETYYVKDAWSILTHGVEWCDKTNANALVVSGHTDIFTTCQNSTTVGEYVVQPEVGKQLMAVGEWIFGLTSFGWRFAPAVVGTLAILVMCRVARRFTRSTLLGCLAGLLLSLDGLEFVLSRTGILDIFLMFFILAAFGCLLVDRDVSRSRLATAMVMTRPDEAGPGLGIRKWRVAAGIMLGLACASKQYGAWYVIAFILLAVFWDIGARKTAGVRDYVRGGLVRDGKWLPLTLGVIPVVVYTLTWTNWLVTSTGYDRQYAASKGFNVPVLSALYSLINYHKQMLQFGLGLSTRHPYMSQPWDWVVISRPVAFYYECYTSASATQICPSGYTGPEWSQEVLAMGNPAIWWASIPAMLFCLGWWFTRRDWRAGAAVLSVAAGWLTWFPFVSRTKFFYYALEFEPFVILCIVLCLGLILGPALRNRPRLAGAGPGLAGGLGLTGDVPGLAPEMGTATLTRRIIGAAIVSVYTLAVLYLFWYFYPILAGKVIPYADWYAHMWYHGWI
jgi:dolichyl-phosphate-mannose--protein O-mannosyl transferase